MPDPTVGAREVLASPTDAMPEPKRGKSPPTGQRRLVTPARVYAMQERGFVVEREVEGTFGEKLVQMFRKDS